MNVLHDAGLRQESITCIGHSMGAHICGLLHYHILFDLNKIIGEYLFTEIKRKHLKIFFLFLFYIWQDWTQPYL